jgi:hypothetical protein
VTLRRCRAGDGREAGAPGADDGAGAAAPGAGAAATFGAGDMAAATWGDVALRVGAGARYVYCHQGCCEHALYIADARRVHAGDPRARAAYPLQTFQARGPGQGGAGPWSGRPLRTLCGSSAC